MLGEDRLRMKLYTFDLMLAVTQCHHESIGRLSRYFQAFRHRVPLHDERMIPTSVEIAFQTVEDRLSIVPDPHGFPMYRLGCTDDLPAKILPDRLMTEANAEQRHLRGETFDNIQCNAGVIRSSGTGG